MTETKGHQHNGCIDGARHASRLDAYDKELARLQAVDQEQWTMINQIHSRLPVWTTAIISLLTLLIGVLLTLVAVRR